MSKFEIKLDTRSALSSLMKSDVDSFKTIVGTFVDLMEVAASKQWHTLPETVHTSLSFQDIVTGVLNAVMTTGEIDEKAYSAIGSDLHPLALLSDNRRNIVSGEKRSEERRVGKECRL